LTSPGDEWFLSTSADPRNEKGSGEMIRGPISGLSCEWFAQRDAPTGFEYDIERCFFNPVPDGWTKIVLRHPARKPISRTHKKLTDNNWLTIPPSVIYNFNLPV